MTQNTVAGHHWLHDWINEFEVSDPSEVEEKLSIPGAADRLSEIAQANRKIEYSHVPFSGAVVAGLGLETDSPSTCGSFSCRRPSLDSDLGALLHYFDFVVMQGPSPGAYTDVSGELNHQGRRSYLIYRLRDDVRLLRYMRDTGMSNYIIFANKVGCYCPTHFQENASNIGLADACKEENLTEVAARIVRAGQLSLEQVGERRWYGAIRDPLYWGMAGKEYRRRKPTEQRVAKDLLWRELQSVVFDAASAGRLGLPLTSLIVPRAFEENLPSVTDRTIDEAASHLRIPILSNLTTAEFIKLREREPDHFEAFRANLREAIAETIERYPNAPVSTIGEFAWQDRVKPAVADLERQVRSHWKSLKMRSTASLSIGAASAAIASVATAPWAAAMLGAAVAASLPLIQISEYFKDRNSAEMSRVYFLWKARQAQPHL